MPFMCGVVYAVSLLNAYIAFTTPRRLLLVLVDLPWKKDALTKHMGRAAHIHTEAVENGPLSVTEILHTTAIVLGTFIVTCSN